MSNKEKQKIKKDTQKKISETILHTTESLSVKSPSRKLKKVVKKASRRITRAVLSDLKQAAKTEKKVTAEKKKKKAPQSVPSKS